MRYINSCSNRMYHDIPVCHLNIHSNDDDAAFIVHTPLEKIDDCSSNSTSSSTKTFLVVSNESTKSPSWYNAILLGDFSLRSN